MRRHSVTVTCAGLCGKVLVDHFPLSHSDVTRLVRMAGGETVRIKGAGVRDYCPDCAPKGCLHS